jgi:hypothetical protein
MTNTVHTQPAQHVFPRQASVANGQQPRSGVGQDKGTPKFQRVASQQPDPLQTSRRATTLNTNTDRSQKSFTGTRKAVKATTWLHPLVKAELERKAAITGLSLSKVMATALEEWVQQDIHAQHDALLYPMIRQIIREELRTFSNRIVFFLMRIAFSAEQARILITNVLDRMSEVTQESFTSIVDRSHTTARKNIIHKTPQIKTLLEEWEASFADAGKEGTHRGL